MAERRRTRPSRLRELARPDDGTGSPPPERASGGAALAGKARAVLEAEFERALALKEKLAAEASAGGRADPAGKLRSIVASLEGANRFALAMGLITPAESRELFAAAMKRGLYEGWR